MASRRRRAFVLLLAAALVAAGAAASVWALRARDEAAQAAAGTDYPEVYERSDDLYFTIVDEGGNTICQTGLYVVVGDEYVAADNQHYRVVSIQGDRCQAVKIGVFSLETGVQQAAAPGGMAAPEAVEQPKTSVIGVYHSHGDESYVPGDGSSSKSNGGISDVARSLIKSSQKEGLKVQYDDERHAPHDSGAYRRSRRTATALMRKGAATLLDIHRDAAPKQAYDVEIDGEPASKVMLVVGRANPQMQTTLNFVRSFKRTLDQKYPGMVRGIYFGRGSYNQDLSPRALLVEVGSHRTPKEQATRTAGLVGEALPSILGAAGAPAAGGGQASLRNLGWILLVVLVGGGAYLVVGAGGFRQALSKLRGFTRREFASALTPRDRGRRGPGRDGYGEGGGYHDGRARSRTVRVRAARGLGRRREGGDDFRDDDQTR